MKASEFMTATVVSCNQNQTVEEAATLMAKHGFSVLPIVDDSGALVGIITESDFVSKVQNIPHALVSLKQLFGQSFHHTDVEDIYKQSKNKRLGDVMTKDPKTVSASSSLDDVVDFMSSKDLKRVPVLDDGKLVGIITRKNLIKAFNQIK